MIVIYIFDWMCLSFMFGDFKGLIIGCKEDGMCEDYVGCCLCKFWFDMNDCICWKDFVIIILVIVVIERINLVIVVGVGVVVACLFYVWDNFIGFL